MEAPPPDLSLVVPCHGGGERVDRCFARLLAWAASEPRLATEIVWVDDGSADDGFDRARRWAARRRDVRLIRLPRHLGKGAALRVGMVDARGRAVVEFDADLPVDPAGIGALLAPLGEGADVVVGRRSGRGARALGPQPPGRRLLDRLHRALARVLLRVRVSDVTCAFKAFRGDVANRLYSRTRARGRGIDAEVLHLAARERLVVREVPVTWRPGPATAAPPLRDAFRAAGELLGARWEHRRRR